MNRLLPSIILCILFSANLFAQTNLLRELLDLPAPPVVSKSDDENERPKEFYDDKNPPADDAPIEDLLDYWSVKANATYTGDERRPTASVKTSLQLIAVVADAPYKFNGFLKILPIETEVLQRVKQLYEAKQSTTDVSDSWRKEVKDWLKFNSVFFIGELLTEAQAAKDHPKYSSINKEDELKALVRLDWEYAKSVLEKLENDRANPRTATLAKTLFYEHALKEKDDNEAEKYRSQLKAIVENKNNKPAVRDAAMDALSETDWQGRDDWYISLLGDDTLLNPTEEYRLYSPLTTVAEKNPDRWIPILTNLVGNKNRAVHNAVVQSLVGFKRRDALEPLLPWLSNPDWTDLHWSGSDRVYYMQIVADIDLPESIPGLIWIVENDDENVHWAARSLSRYKDARAIPALKNALARIGEETYRQTIIDALLDCGGLTADEQMSALESYAVEISKPDGKVKVESRSEYEDENPLPAAVSIGRHLANLKDPSEDLIIRLIGRQKILQKEKPEVAKILSGIMSKWQGRLVDLEMLDRIGEDAADTETIIGALARRKDLREKVSGEIYTLRGKIGLAGGIAACLLEDESEIVSAFHSTDVETQIGTLACARLLRLPLPIQEVSASLDSRNKLLALAAERYLESEDSIEARQLVLAKHKGEALILGARDSFNPAKKTEYPATLGRLFASVNQSYGSYLLPEQSYFAEFDKFENKLRDEIKTNPDLLEIYAVPSAYAVRVYRNRVVFTWYENAARWRERVLEKKEFDDLKEFFAASKFEESPPVFGGCHHDCGAFEYVRLNRDGGRRFFAYTSGFSFIRVWFKFQELRESGAMKLRYYLQDKIAGLEVLPIENKFRAKAVWKSGDDFRVLVADEERGKQIDDEIDKLNKIDDEDEEMDYEERGVMARKRRAERAYEHYEWREFKNGKLAEKVDEPVKIPFLRDKLSFPSVENLSDNDSIWQAKSGNYEIRVGSNYDAYGLWKVNRSETIKIGDGWFGGKPIVSGNWAVAAKTDDNWARPNYVVRVNLQTRRELKINLPPADDFEPIAFAAAHNKILLRRAADDNSETKTNNPSPSAPEYYLLDADTGKTELVKGEFQPLARQTFRSLQPTGKPNEFWAAVYNRAKNETDIGRYDAKNFNFQSVLKLPEILLDSMEIWVDEKEAKVYFVYAGDYGDEAHLLSLPLPKEK